MSHRALSELHIVPQGQTKTGAYYRDYILAKTCKDALKRKAKRGPILKVAMSRNMSEIVFQQDGAPPIWSSGLRSGAKIISPTFGKL